MFDSEKSRVVTFISLCVFTGNQLEMLTTRFGTTISPQNRTTAKETDEKGKFDPDKLLQCPFDKNHQIRSCRFPYHLIKCRKNHPKLASELKTCPFNARHLVPKHELPHHTETCEDRTSVDPRNGGNKWQVPVSSWVNTSMTEDWDEEADDSAAPFVWGVNVVLNDKPTNNLGPTFRAPNTLPWF
ncbi:gametocyte-specific factor 1 [Chelmon rostratus]|uniref:gametocyte-specific factor 1 n=1 Tax=Chelmon rostratus TaxID=109905 RepID=UPI001BE80BB8|nr:gametocyte-specific factor 1 [Chelmon rostratus]